jgi:guanylate kinase
MIDRGEFAEWAQVHGNRYGTSRRVVEDALASGRHVVFDVDWQGGRSLAWQWPLDALQVFILPPDLDALEDRLRRRATDSEEVIQGRLRAALDELGHHTEYRHRIVNDKMDAAYAELRAVYMIRRDGAAAHPELVSLEEKTRSREVKDLADRLVAGRTGASPVHPEPERPH